MQLVTPTHPRARVGFVIPRWTCDPVFECQGIPFRAISVAGALFNAGYEIVWFDQEPDLDRQDRRSELRAELSSASIVFFWMNELDPQTQTQNALDMAREIKSWYPDIVAVVGGEFITICPEDAIEVAPPFDYYIRGNGEEAAVELMTALDGALPMAGVSGLVWRNGEQRANPIRRHQKYLPEFLSLYRRLDLRPYLQTRGGIFGNGVATLTIGTSRGCPKQCGFCYWSKHEPSMLGAEDIVELAAYLRATYGVTQFHIGELDFATNRRRVLRMAELWQERLPDATWFALMSPSDAIRFTDGDWDRIAAGGCRKIELGAETGSAKMLAAIGKRHQPDDPVEISDKLLAHGIMPMHNFVFGLYGESRHDRRETLRLIRKLQSLEHAEWITFTFRFFQPAWGTTMGDQAIAETPDYPVTIAEVMQYRGFFGDESSHAMKWLRAPDERLIKRMVFHYLPLTTSKHQFDRPVERVVYRALRGIARLRLRTRYFGAGLDRWVYDRFIRRRLDNTYRL